MTEAWGHVKTLATSETPVPEPPRLFSQVREGWDLSYNGDSLGRLMKDSPESFLTGHW